MRTSECGRWKKRRWEGGKELKADVGMRKAGKGEGERKVLRDLGP
jgi:hypothetical protein